jgi:hypothetical protein
MSNPENIKLVENEVSYDAVFKIKELSDPGCRFPLSLLPCFISQQGPILRSSPLCDNECVSTGAVAASNPEYQDLWSKCRHVTASSKAPSQFCM